jgi:hypothetical protein
MWLTKTFAGYSKSRTKFTSVLCVKMQAFYIKQMALCFKGLISGPPPTHSSYL